MLRNHIIHKSGKSKTVCSSAALGFFGIHPSQYHYSGNMDGDAAILRRFGFAVRSRKSKFGVNRKRVTLGAVRRAMANGKGEAGGHYMVSIRMGSGTFHRIVLSPQGQIVVDTAAAATNNRCMVRDVRYVFRA